MLTDAFIEGATRTRALAKRTLNVFGDRVFWRKSRAEINKLVEAYGDGGAEGIYEIFDRYRGMGWYRGVGASQVRSEFKRLIEEVSHLLPYNVVEIGTARGGTLLAWCRIAGKRVISIDLPGGAHGGGYVADRMKFYRLFCRHRPGVRLSLLREDSHSEKTREKVQALLQGEKIQFLFIDGDHHYAGVKRDFELWSGLVGEGGIVALHDIGDHKGHYGVNVQGFWKEVKPKFRHAEFIEDPDQGWGGIGLIYL